MSKECIECSYKPAVPEKPEHINEDCPQCGAKDGVQDVGEDDEDEAE